jgi:hypothetical protein
MEIALGVKPLPNSIFKVFFDGLFLEVIIWRACLMVTYRGEFRHDPEDSGARSFSALG